MSRKIVRVQRSFRRGLVLDGDPSKFDSGQIDDGQNFRIDRLGSVYPRTGSWVDGPVPNIPSGTDIKNILPFSDSSGKKAILISDGKNVWAQNENNITWNVGSFPSEGDIFRGVMAFNRAYFVNGKDRPFSLRFDSGQWKFREVGLDKPPPPSLVSGQGFGTDLANPPFPATEMYVFRGAQSLFIPFIQSNERTVYYYDSLSDSWNSTPAIQNELGMWGFEFAPKIGNPPPRETGFFFQMNDGRVGYSPSASDVRLGDRIVSVVFMYDPINQAWDETERLLQNSGAPNYNSYYRFAPASYATVTTGLWSTSVPLVTSFVTVDGVSTINFRVSTLKYSTDQATGKALVVEDNIKIIEDYSGTPRVEGSAIIPVDQAQFGDDQMALVLYSFYGENIVRMKYGKLGVIGGNFSDSPSSRLNGVTLNEDGSVYYNGGDSFFLFPGRSQQVFQGKIKRIGGTYRIDWTDVSADFQNRNFDLTYPAAPSSALLFYINGTDFGAVSPAVSGGNSVTVSLDVGISAIDELGNESSVSQRLSVNDAQENGAITISIPQITKSITVTDDSTGSQSQGEDISSVKVYRTFQNQQGGTMYLAATISGNGGGQRTLLLDDSVLDTSITAKDFNNPPETGARFIGNFLSRLFIANTSSAKTRVSFSNVESGSIFPEAFPDILKIDVGAEDSGTITGTANFNGLIVLKDNGVFVLPDDIEKTNFQLRAPGLGNDVEGAVVSTKEGAVWIKKGLGPVIFDGFNVREIGPLIVSLADRIVDSGSAHLAFNGTQMFIFFNLDGKGQALVYEMSTTRRWSRDVFPSQTIGATFLPFALGRIKPGLISWTDDVPLDDPIPTKTPPRNPAGIYRGIISHYTDRLNDVGNWIRTSVTLRRFKSPSEFKEVNWHDVVVDFYSSGDYNITLNVETEEGEILDSLEDISGNGNGKIDVRRNIPSRHTGRFNSLTLDFSRYRSQDEVRIDRVFVTGFRRERRPK